MSKFDCLFKRLSSRVLVVCSVGLIVSSFGSVSYADGGDYVPDGEDKSSTVLEKPETAPVEIPVVKIEEVDEDGVLAGTVSSKIIIELKPEPVEVVEPVVRNPEQASRSAERANTGVSEENEPEPQEAAENPSEGQEKGLNKNGTVNKVNSFISPVKNPVKTSDFGYRTHPISGGSKLHSGVDYGAACGTKIYAPASGVVTKSSWKNSTAGNVITIRHDELKGNNGEVVESVITTNYYHLSEFSVSVGNLVNQGQVIGEVGTTGRSTGCHLHWEMTVDGEKVDPTDFLTDENYDETIYSDEQSSKTSGEEIGETVDETEQ